MKATINYFVGRTAPLGDNSPVRHVLFVEVKQENYESLMPWREVAQFSTERDGQRFQEYMNDLKDKARVPTTSWWDRLSSWWYE